MEDETILALIVGLLIFFGGNVAIIVIYFVGLMSLGGSLFVGLFLVISLGALLVPKIFYDYWMGHYNWELTK